MPGTAPEGEDRPDREGGGELDAYGQSGQMAGFWQCAGWCSTFEGRCPRPRSCADTTRWFRGVRSES